jgi:hypothetical protein
MERQLHEKAVLGHRTLTRRNGLLKNRPLLSRPRPPAVSVHAKWLIAVVVVALLLGGTATAAHKITGSDVADSTLTGKDVKDSSITGSDIRDRSLSPRDFSESVRGPAGPPGPAGPTGATGPNGFRVLTQHVGSPVAVAANGVQTVTALCDAGEITVSGGWLQTAGTGGFLMAASLAGADPSTGRDGWTILVREVLGAAGSIEAIAYCAPLPAAAAAASAASTRARSALGAHQQAWQHLHKVAVAMRGARLASRRK